MAERHATIHTASTLLLEDVVVVTLINFMEIVETYEWIAGGHRLPFVFLKAGWFTHDKSSNLLTG
jgi:hypothetical protein